MELRLVIGYTLLFLLLCTTVFLVMFRRQLARDDFHKRWGKQKRARRPNWFW